MKETVIQKLIDIASLEVGTREEGGNNKGLRIHEYQKATWLPPGAWPWCAAYVAHVVQRWLGNNLVRETLGLKTIEEAENWRCRDASAFGWIAWAKKRGLCITDEKELAKRGDLVVFDFSHIGIVEFDQVKLGDKIQTIEGNTAPKTTQRDGNNDGVYRMQRSPSLVKAYIRIIE